MCPHSDVHSRRHVLALFVNTTVSILGAGLAALLGVFAARPPRDATQTRWVRAATMIELTPGVPLTRVLLAASADGWYRGRSRAAVFLIPDRDRQVRALSATCTHLGCRVRWDGADRTFRCPCHGGVYDAAGAVMDGPPVRPLDELPARVEADGTILVQV